MTVEVSKTTTFTVLRQPSDAVAASKVTAYAVTKAAAPAGSAIRQIVVIVQ